MFKLLYLPFFVVIISCNSQEQQGSEQKEKNFSEMTPKEKVEDVKKDIIPTDKDSKYQEWFNNVYRNTKYEFRIEFPKGWEYDNGTSKSTLARAFNREKAAVIAVTITEFKSSPKNILEIDTKEYENNLKGLMALQNQEPKNLKITKGKLNNFPAYILELTSLQSSGTKSYEYFSKQVHCYNNTKLYIIALNLPLDEWTQEMSITFDRVVESFNFEIVY